MYKVCNRYHIWDMPRSIFVLSSRVLFLIKYFPRHFFYLTEQESRPRIGPRWAKFSDWEFFSKISQEICIALFEAFWPLMPELLDLHIHIYLQHVFRHWIQVVLLELLLSKLASKQGRQPFVWNSFFRNHKNFPLTGTFCRKSKSTSFLYISLWGA